VTTALKFIVYVPLLRNTSQRRRINQEQLGLTENNTVGLYLYCIKGTSYSRKFSLQGKIRK